MAEIDNSSFVLGKLTGQMEDLVASNKELITKVDKLQSCMNHQKVKQAGLSATVAIVFSFMVAAFKDHFTKG